MADSACPKCATSNFEAKVTELAQMNFKTIFIQCADCGTVIGITPYIDAGIVSTANKSLLGLIINQLNGIESKLAQIQQR